jgi:hypothetical protein
MTRQFRNFAGLAMLLTAIAATGQLSHQSRVNVPFAFMAAGRSLPAGDYRVDMDLTRALVTLSAYNSKPIMFLTVRAWQPQNAQSYLRFRRYGERWFLQEVAVDGLAQEVPVGKIEKQFIAANTPPDNSKAIIADIVVH